MRGTTRWPTRTPRGLQDLWGRPDPNAPELQHHMQRMAGIWASQSSVERSNGLIQFTSGCKRRSKMAHGRLTNVAIVADRLGREGREQKRGRAQSSPLWWAPGSPLQAAQAEGGMSSTDDDASEESGGEGPVLAPPGGAVGSDSEWTSFASQSDSSEASEVDEG